jgi:hypothetical protein
MGADSNFDMIRMGGSMVIVDRDGLIYGGTRLTDPKHYSKTRRLLDLVSNSYELGAASGPQEDGIHLDILMGWGEDGQSRIWTIMDDLGRVHATVPRGLWPFPGKEVENLSDVLENACRKGWEKALDREAVSEPAMR